MPTCTTNPYNFYLLFHYIGFLLPKSWTLFCFLGIESFGVTCCFEVIRLASSLCCACMISALSCILAMWMSLSFFPEGLVFPSFVEVITHFPLSSSKLWLSGQECFCSAVLEFNPGLSSICLNWWPLATVLNFKLLDALFLFLGSVSIFSILFHLLLIF